MAGEIKFSGIASGIAFDELIAKMVEAERYQAKKLETWKKTWQDKVDTLKDLSSRVSSLQNTNNILKSASSFISRLVTSTNNAVADVTVDSSSLVGSYKVQVADAVKHKVGSKGVETRDQGMGNAGSEVLSFRDGDNKLISVTLTADMSLDELCSEINDAIDGAGSTAKAEIINDGSSHNPYRLVITSAVAGTEGQIEFITDTTGLSFTKQSMDTAFEDIGTGNASNILNVAGSYTGHNSKRFTFTVDTGGDVESGNVRIRWEDATDGKSGIVTVSGLGDVTITQGVKINVTAGTLTKGEQFALDVYAPDIQIGQDRGLAQAAQVTHSGLSGRTAVVTQTAGTFQYSYRGVDSMVINVPENTTLEQFAKLINESPGNPGVRASIINDGGGTAQSFHLVLTGIDSGAANQIEIKQANLTNMDVSEFATTRKATNAILKIDDFPPGADNWIQKSSNLITDLIEGASIRLKDSGTTSLSITNNDEDMADKVQAFVDEYNSLLDFIDDITRVVLDDKGEADINSAGVLTGNYAVQILRSQLRAFIGSRALGFDPDSDDLSLLTQVGMSSNSDTRRLEFDREYFKQVLNSNPDALIKLFSADKIGSLDNNDFIYMSGTGDTKAGNYDFTVNYNALGEIEFVSYKDRNTGITYTSANGNDIRISADKKNFTIFAGGARGVAIQGVEASGTNTFTLSVKDGKAKSFDEEMKKLFDIETGITKVLEKNYENIIRNIDRRIEREDMRLLQVKKRLEMRFARLEVNMQNYNGQMERLQQQIASLGA